MLSEDYSELTISRDMAAKLLHAHDVFSVRIAIRDSVEHIHVASEYMLDGKVEIEWQRFFPDASGRYSVQTLRDYLGY